MRSKTLAAAALLLLSVQADVDADGGRRARSTESLAREFRRLRATSTGGDAETRRLVRSFDQLAARLIDDGAGCDEARRLLGAPDRRELAEPPPAPHTLPPPRPRLPGKLIYDLQGGECPTSVGLRCESGRVVEKLQFVVACG